MRILVLSALALLLTAPALASPVPHLPPAQQAPAPGPDPVTHPAPGERLVPIPDSETITGAHDRVALIFAHWTHEDGTPRVPFVDLHIEGDHATVGLAHDPLLALDDHDRELLLLALFGALFHPAPEVRRLSLDAVHPDGTRVPESVWSPRSLPLETPEDVDCVTGREPACTPPPGPLLPVLQQEGPLSGRRIALSPGHGWTWLGSSWATQRSDSYGLIEDFLTATISREHVDPYLVAAGADVVWMRERSSELHATQIVDDGDSGYAESGEGFSQGANPGGWDGDYRFMAADNAQAIVSWQAPFAARHVPVFAWWVPGGNRNPVVLYRVHHAGGTTEVRRDQQRGGPHWQFLGTFHLDDDSQVELVGESGAEGVSILDAIRFGTSTGGIRRNGAASGHPGWQENARNYAEFSGAPSAVYAARANERDSDIVARPLWSNRLQVDAYVSVHTNAAGGTGTETFIYNGTPPAGSANLRRALQTQLVGDIRAWWNAQWVDRGEKAANFGELRELTNAPGALVEIAFHDRNPATGPDVPSLHDPRFRRIAGRAIARGVVRHFDANVPFVPEPPLDVRAINTADGIEVRFDDTGAREGAGAATSWRIYLAFDDGAFDGGTVVDEPRFLIDTLVPGDSVHVRVAGRNAGGTGLPSRTVSARRGAGNISDVLLVNAYRRWDRSTGELGNTGDEVRRWSDAIASAWPVADLLGHDGATREAFADGRTSGHGTVLWQAGRDEAPFPAVTAAEADRLVAVLDGGGRVLLSGAHVLSDLAESLGQHALTGRVDARTTGRRAPPALADGGIFVQQSTRDESAVPEVDTFVLDNPANGGLQWSDGASAAFWRRDAGIAVAAFPVEGIADTTERGARLRTLLVALGVEGEDGTEPGDGTGDSDDGADDSDGGTGDSDGGAGDTDGGSGTDDGQDVADGFDGASDDGDAPDPTGDGVAPGDVGDADDAQDGTGAPTEPGDAPDPASDDSSAAVDAADGTDVADRTPPVRQGDESIYGYRALPGEGPIEVGGCAAAPASPTPLAVLLLLGLVAVRRRR